MPPTRLRLTEQVPARQIYLTSGRSRTIEVGPTTIELLHRTPRKPQLPISESARVFAALRNIGQATSRRNDWPHSAPCSRPPTASAC